MTPTPRVHTALARRRGKSPEQRLAMDVAHGAPAECWPWTGAQDGSGYGRVHTATGGVRMHRVAYEAANGPIPQGLVVRHSCDNRVCCNPSHLILGTHADNRRDCVERDRQAKGERIGAHVLNEDAVRVARRRHVAGERIAVLADEYGVTFTAMWRALAGITWGHVDEEAAA